MRQRSSSTPHVSRPRARALTAAAMGLTLLLGASSTAAFAQTPALASAPTARSEAPPIPASIQTDASSVESLTSDAKAALAAAATVAADATALNGEVAASGLTVDAPTTVSVSAVEAATADLDGLDLLPIVLLPSLTSAVTDAVADTQAKIDRLRERLAAAVAAEEARRAAEEAAAKAAAEEAARVAAEEAARAAAAAAPAVSGPVASTGDNSPGAAQAAARDIMASQYGWGDGEFSCLVALWNKESGWNYAAYNSSSGAGGIPQALPASKMSSAGGDWASNAVTQVRWGLGYIAGRYGSPCNAWSHSQSTGWY